MFIVEILICAVISELLFCHLVLARKTGSARSVVGVAFACPQLNRQAPAYPKPTASTTRLLQLCSHLRIEQNGIFKQSQDDFLHRIPNSSQVLRVPPCGTQRSPTEELPSWRQSRRQLPQRLAEGCMLRIWRFGALVSDSSRTPWEAGLLLRNLD